MPITHLSEAGLEFIRLFEGAYLSTEVVSSLEKEVSELVTAPINQNQFDALVSFSFNVGLGNLQASTLRQKLNRGDYEGAANEFPKWRKAGGRVLQGLVRRRADEKAMFMSDVIHAVGY